MRVWRISSARHASFDGEGARLYGSRWTPRGVPAVFTSATLSLAVLERFVHTGSDVDVSDLVAIPVEISDDIRIDAVALKHLPADWRAFPVPPSLMRIGQRWLESSQTAVLTVPSVVIPHERNVLFNPRHPDFANLGVGRAEPFCFDPRMSKKDVNEHTNGIQVHASIARSAGSDENLTRNLPPLFRVKPI
jgi:RES domain-containing protein